MEAVMLNSGGLDTLIVASKMHSLGYDLHSLYIGLGQENHDTAIESARRIAEKYCVGHEEIELTGQPYTRLFDNGFLGLPFQAPLVTMIGCTYTSSRKLEYLISGLKRDSLQDHFFDTFTDMLACNKIAKPITIIRPVFTMSLQDIVNDGLKLGITIDDMKNTVSCNHKVPCGNCRKCVERKSLGL